MARPASPPGADHAAEQAQDHIPPTLPPIPPDARPASPPGADHAAEQAQDHIPTTLPPIPPDARPASPPGADHAAEQAQDHIPTTLPPEHDTFVFTALTEPTLSEHAVTNAADEAQEHLPTELPAIQLHDVTLPEAAGHMTDVAVGHLDWFIL